MTSKIRIASGDRLLAIIPRSDISTVLAEHTGRPIAALLTSHSDTSDPTAFDSLILSLLDKGCEYFVCFGTASEALHDRVDELAIERTFPPDRIIMTTWHDNETVAEVTDFFFNVAATKRRTLLIAALGPSDTELARLLVEHASG